MGAPALTVAAAVLAMTRSAWGVTAVAAESVLLAGVGSAVEDATALVLVTVPELCAVSLTLTLVFAPEAMYSFPTRRSSDLIEQPGLDVVGDTRLAGRSSVTVGATAVDGPL